MVIAFFIAAAMNLFSYWNADKMVLSHEPCASRSTSALRRNSTASCAIWPQRAGLPMPKVYLIDNPQPNAFATGRNPQNAAVAATTGLLNRLSYEEVAGVMAHELAHVKNRDTLTMTITATLAGAISMLGNFAFFFGGNREQQQPARHRRRAGRDDRRADRGRDRADGDQPHARIRGRPARRRDLRPSAVARLGA